MPKINGLFTKSVAYLILSTTPWWPIACKIHQYGKHLCKVESTLLYGCKYKLEFFTFLYNVLIFKMFKLNFLILIFIFLFYHITQVR